jgi:hypothetical protein
MSTNKKPNFPIAIIAIIILAIFLAYYIYNLDLWFVGWIANVIIIFFALRIIWSLYDDYSLDLRMYESNLKEAKRIEKENSAREFKNQIKLMELTKQKANLTTQIMNKCNELKLKHSDSHGGVKMIGNDFKKLLLVHEDEIVAIDQNSGKNFFHDFVKISRYIDYKGEILNNLYNEIDEIKSKISFSLSGEQNLDLHVNSLRKSDNDTKIVENLLRNQIEIREQIIFHAINMAISFLNKKMFVYHDIYEMFDKIGIFNTAWQNDVTEKINSIGSKLDKLQVAIETLDWTMKDGFRSMSYVFQESITGMEETINDELNNINSNLRFNNILTAIQAYDTNKIMKSMK